MTERPPTEAANCAPPAVCLRDADRGCWRVYRHPSRIVCARSLSAVLPALAEVEQASAAGRHAAGFVSYEAAPAFDAALPAKEDPSFPLLWFALFDEAPAKYTSLDAWIPAPQSETGAEPIWQLPFSEEEYLERVKTVREYIRRGDTYQVNLTHRLRAANALADPWRLFAAMAAPPAPPQGGIINTGEWLACSASPELFFTLQGEQLLSRPMKGTAGRGLWFEQDEAQAAALYKSAKDRAENLMIVDMVRNDFGRVARSGSVAVPRLFDVERYPTVWQMTSTVSAETEASLVDIFRALFPPASITGAPKRRTMQIIDELEDTPRRIYTGAMGWIEPGRRASFNVAIRTPLVHCGTGAAEYGVGGGIVWDSDPAAEAQECRIKTRVLHHRPPPFELLETLRWRPETGYDLLDLHRQRLANSAQYFEFAFDESEVREQLRQFAQTLANSDHRVRLTLARSGRCSMEASPLSGPGGFHDLVPAAGPVDRANAFLYHKTTQRTVYAEAKDSRPGTKDVLLYNEQGEVTESTIANLAVDDKGQWLTPPLQCGLLPGTMRRHLLDQGRLVERVVLLEEVLERGEVILFNSLRGIQRVAVRR